MDALCLLPGWQKSVGATAEAALAQWRQIPIYEFPDMTKIVNVRLSSYAATGEYPEPPKPMLIAFTGAKQSGKTTLAKLLCKEGLNVRKSFAQPMRDMLSAMGVEDRYLYEYKTTPIPYLAGSPTARHLMQTIGTEWGRDCIHKDLWVTLAIDGFKRQTDNDFSVFVDDLRFPNEAEMFRKAGGIIVKIYRDGLTDADEHESEKYWKAIDSDFTIRNNGTPEELLDLFKRSMEEYGHGKI